MPPKKNKKKASAANSRGFATTSVASKAKEAALATPVESPTPPEPVVELAEPQDIVIDRERAAQEALESATIVENGTRAFNKIWSEVQVERRSRKACIPIALPETIIAQVLTLAQASTSRLQKQTAAESMSDLYCGEILLRELGLSEDLVKTVLTHTAMPSSPEKLLYYIATATDHDILYDFLPERPMTPVEDDRALTPPPSAKPRNNRVMEIYSDEEDQDEIAASPNKYYVENQLNLLVMRGRIKKEPDLAPNIAKLEKRSRVIACQIGFNRQSAAKQVQRAVQGGHLARAAQTRKLELTKMQAAPKADSPVAIPAVLQEEQVSDSESDSDDEWMAVQGSGSRSSSPSRASSRASLVLVPDDLTTDQVKQSAASDVEEEELGVSALFAAVDSPPTTASSPDESVALSPFPLVLPRLSQNVSPVKLLEQRLKRADKSAKIDFLDNNTKLVIRFRSAKVSRRKVSVDEKLYGFPDQDTARNFLSMRALFSVPELATENFGARFTGEFRDAWRILKDEDAEVQRLIVEGKLRNVREVHLARQSLVVPSPKTALGPAALPSSHRSHHKTTRDTSDVNVQRMFEQMRCSEAYMTMYEHRAQLPIAAYRSDLLHAIQNNQITILCGETGCGKSTQLPTYILESELASSRHCKIYVTEPRRISAISLAMRVSSELGEPRRAIERGESLLGFSIRLDSQISDNSRLVYATTGIVLRMLEESPDLGGITHLILDEVHERSIESDFLLIVVRRLLRTRRDLKIVLMSATLQAEVFNDYFGGHCCIFKVPGRTFPVEQKFLEDVIESSGYICDEGSYFAKRGAVAERVNTEWEIPEDREDEDEDAEEDLITYSDRTKRALKLLDPYKVNFDLILKLLDKLAKEPSTLTQAVLIFMPGMGEIRRLFDTLQAHKVFGDERKWLIYALHSSIASDKQQAAFDVPQRGIRKIVIATNIAETGITIPDITCVIDAGKHKESRFDARRQLSRLVETFIAKANARQRMGRAGRVQPGVCYHLFSRARFNKMAEHQLPEFQRLNLDELALRVKTVGMGGIEEVLLEALDAPTPENIKRSIASLIQVGALDEDQNLTSLGRYLARLPVDATLGKLILYGVRYSCLDPCLVIAAAQSSKAPFDTPMGREREASAAKQLFSRGDSDFLTTWTAYQKWRQVCIDKPAHEQKFCRDSFLNGKSLAAIEELRLQYLKILVDAGLLQVGEQDRRAIQRARFMSSRDGFIRTPAHVEQNTETHTYIELCIAASFYPNMVSCRDGFKTVSKGQVVSIHPSSINHGSSGSFAKPWVAFFSLLKTKGPLYAHDTGLVDDYVVALFCGNVEFKPLSGIISIDRNRIRFRVGSLRTCIALAVLRNNLARCFARFMDRRTSLNEAVQDEEAAWLNILGELIKDFDEVHRQRLR
ncbi:P-loop containing nucleoside triphosphate hydrolase protein [Protomyces lactucae-debilis]|uniref:RNA helicase n=1 Tax=Protomyces lactucae-debilis TaxID=2754530 RepID=A0A1Y2FDU9_PROLT|nr:P-loop containing nucleoside triphosphate hydrolase protein [Protomyces lactucae-debilis]ORY82099.1 P-loop containing nucleoside triphosphate hydrolase protein [Protomyces lactucae-debilis]